MTAMSWSDASRLSSRITSQARQVRIVPTLLTVAAALLWAVGWVAARALLAVWQVLVWSCVAVQVDRKSVV